MNFIKNESDAKLRGGYYTDPDIAYFLTKWILEIHPKKILEPSCGDGIFIKTLSRFNSPHVQSFVGVDIESSEAMKASDKAHKLKNVDVKIYAEDFLNWSLLQIASEQTFDAVIGNPPFIRYQYLNSNLQARSQKIFEYLNLPFTMPIAVVSDTHIGFCRTPVAESFGHSYRSLSDT